VTTDEHRELIKLIMLNYFKDKRGRRGSTVRYRVDDNAVITSLGALLQYLLQRLPMHIPPNIAAWDAEINRHRGRHNRITVRLGLPIRCTPVRVLLPAHPPASPYLLRWVCWGHVVEVPRSHQQYWLLPLQTDLVDDAGPSSRKAHAAAAKAFVVHNEQLVQELQGENQELQGEKHALRGEKQALESDKRALLERMRALQEEIQAVEGKLAGVISIVLPSNNAAAMA
jgi:FtsZ-binding cell division protein ZapB